MRIDSTLTPLNEAVEACDLSQPISKDPVRVETAVLPTCILTELETHLELSLLLDSHRNKPDFRVLGFRSCWATLGHAE